MGLLVSPFADTCPVLTSLVTVGPLVGAEWALILFVFVCMRSGGILGHADVDGPWVARSSHADASSGTDCGALRCAASNALIFLSVTGQLIKW